MPDTDLDRRIEDLLDRADWWRLPPAMTGDLEALLQELYLDGLNLEAGRIEALRLGLDRPPFMALAWDLQDQRVR